MTTYVIGDVQGCFADLERLLDRIQFDYENDHLWFVGDLVNRGGASLQVLRFVNGLGPRATTVLGNHDLHLLAVACHLSPPRHSDTFIDVLKAPDRDELLDWLRTRPLMHYDRRLNVAMVHAGIYPFWNISTARTRAAEVEQVLRSADYRALIGQLYGDFPDKWSEHLDGWDRLRFIVNCFTRMRYCSADGVLDYGAKGPPGSQDKSLRPWFAEWCHMNDAMAIVFGHWSTLGLWSARCLYGLDSGCVWGGALSALRLESPRAVFQVPCKGAQKPGTV